MSKIKPFDRIIHAILQQTDDLCIEVRKDQNIVILHLANGEQEIIKLTPDQFQRIYKLLATKGTPIQKPETIE
jgi:hypothetical protein